MELPTAGLGDLFGHPPGFTYVMEHPAKTEFFFEPEDGEDVVMAMGVVMDHASTFQDFHHGFHLQVARGHFVRITPARATAAGNAGPPRKGRASWRTARAGSREGSAAQGVGSVGHLDAAVIRGDIGVEEHVIDGAGLAQLEVTRLTLTVAAAWA